MTTEIEQAKEAVFVANRRLQLLEQREFVQESLREIENELQGLTQPAPRVVNADPVLLPFPKPILALPKVVFRVRPPLFWDAVPSEGYEIDLKDRSYLPIQTEQILEVFRALTSPAEPFVRASKIKNYILEHFEIKPSDYWMTKTGPREAERWWKQIYDKAIERMDLHLHLIMRADITGKKGLYALREYYGAWHKVGFGG